MKKLFLQTILFTTSVFILAGGADSVFALSNSKPLRKTAVKNKAVSKTLPLKKKADGLRKFSSFPVSFEENKGQADANVKFFSRGKNYNLFLTQTGAIFSIAFPGQSKSQKRSFVKMKPVGANPNAEIKGVDETITKNNYYFGNDTSRWLTDITNYARVRYEKIYEGIDVIYTGAEQNFEYDFHVAPGADPGLIQLDFEGVKKIRIDANGDLVLKLKNGEIYHRKPVAYQIIDGERREVSVSYVLLGKNRIGFKIASYDTTRELIIDPVIYATYLGGSDAQDETRDVAVGSFGNAHIATIVNSSDFLNTTHQTVPGRSDIAITKLSSDGTQIIYNTFVIGSHNDDPYSIDVDSVGNVFIGGITQSSDFPLHFARQTASNTTTGGVEGFICRLSTFGTVTFSTYHGSLNDPQDFVDEVAADTFGNVYAVGITRGNDFPVLNAYQSTLNGLGDAFLSKLDSSGSLLYSTYFGGPSTSAVEDAADVAVDSQGNAYVSGSALHAIPLTPNPYLTTGTGFAAKFNTNASGEASLVYSTKLTKTGRAIAVDSSGNAYIIGSGTTFSPTIGVKLNATGTDIHWSFPAVTGTVTDIALDTGGNAYYAEGLENISGTLQFGVRIRGISSINGSIFGTANISGTQREVPAGITYLDGYIYLVGYTGSTDFPTTGNAIQPNSRYALPGGSPLSGFFAKIMLGEDEDAGNVPCQGQVGMPVNVANGNMYLEQTDYFLPGTGEAINIVRTYNSMIQTPGLFGFGWSFQYDEHIVQYDSDTLRLQMPDGKAVYFTRSNSTTFIPVSAGFYGQITVDTNGNYILTYHQGGTHRFNSGGNLTALVDRDNNETILNYNSSTGRLTSIVDSFSRTLGVTTDNDGRITGLSDSIGAVAAYTYDPLGRLESVTYPDNSNFTFTYETQTPPEGTRYLLTEVKDALLNIVEKHEYYSDGKAKTSERHGGVEKYTFDYSHLNDGTPYTQTTDALNRQSKHFIKQIGTRKVIERVEGICGCGSSGNQNRQWEYDNRLNVTRTINGNGVAVNYTYDANGNMLTEADYTGTKTYTYNPFGQVLTMTDQMSGGLWENTYDTGGHLLTVEDPLNNTTTFTYTPIGQLETFKNARNNTTTLTYDSVGRLTEVKDAYNKTTTFDYDARSRITSTTNALNNTTAFEYDLNNRLKKVTHPDDTYMTYTYDFAGRRTAVTDERLNTTTFEYDSAYRLTKVTDALSHATNFGYNLMSNQTSQTDALGNTIDYEYDDFNRLKKIIYPPAVTSGPRLEERMEYDAVGNVKKRIDTANHETLYDYDPANRLFRITDANLKQTLLQYNARSQMTQVTDALTQVYTFTYDPLGRQLTQSRAGSTLTYEYDEVGNRKKRIDFAGRVTNYTYDNLDRLTQIAYVGQSGDDSTFTYDDLSRMTSAHNYAGTTTRSYDYRNRLVDEIDVFGRTMSYQYDAAGNRTHMVMAPAPADPEGPVESSPSYDDALGMGYEYDASNRLTQMLDDETHQTYTFDYDAANRLREKILPNGVVTTYDYDGMNRLTRLKHDDTSANPLIDNQYSYNSANQISQIVDLNETRSFNYDNLNRLTGMTSNSSPSESYAYNEVGNRTTSHLSSTYSYQPINRLTATATASYVYDASGNRTSRSENGTTQYVWDHENRLRAANNGGWSVQYKYDALGRRVEQTQDGSSTKFTYDGLDVVFDKRADESTTKYVNAPGVDNKLSYFENRQYTYLLQDHLGSTVGETNEGGGLDSQSVYDSFGNVSSQPRTRYQFTGRELDAYTGLYYYRARWYDAGLGRFVSEDPIGLSGGINQYAYVGNNPVNATDALGLYEIDVHYYLTYFLAQKTGCFNDAQARLIADANQGTDENPATKPGLGDRDQNTIYHALHEGASEGKGASDLWAIALNGNTNYVGLGRYLHHYQDTFSHSGYDDSFRGHVFGTHKVDKTADDVEKALKMAKGTFEQLNNFAKAKGCKCSSNWDNAWDDQIRDFAGVETNHPYLSTIDANRFNSDEVTADFPPFFLGGDIGALSTKARILGVSMR